MKNLSILLLFIITVASVTSCKKTPLTECEEKSGTVATIEREIPGQGEMDATIVAYYPLAPTGVWIPLPAQIIETKQDSILGSFCEAERSNVQSIKSKSLTVSIVEPASQTTGFIDSIEVSLDSVGGSSPLLIGYKYNWDQNLKSISLDMVDVNADIKDYFNADSVQVLMRAMKRSGGTLQAGTILDFRALFTMEALLP